jgi:hypothetical protein
MADLTNEHYRQLSASLGDVFREDNRLPDSGMDDGKSTNLLSGKIFFSVR